MRTEKDTLVEQLREAVRGREREKALELLKKGALDGLTKEQRLEIYKSLMTLRNMEIIHYLAKQEEKFSSEMLRMDFEPYLNKNFVRQVLARYRKKFDLTDERECENLFEIACEANDAETVKSPWDGTRRIRDFAAGHCALQLMRPCGIPLVARSGRP